MGQAVEVATRRVVVGDGASAGRVVGRARIVRDAEDVLRVRPGDVLVCRAATRELVALFDSVVAFVTDGGGVLSSAATVARERYLPAVVAATDATSAIADGARVEVDGASGRVTILRCA